MLPCGLKLDLFMPHPDGYGLVMAIRTGSADWAHKVLATRWKRAGFHSDKGLLRRKDESVISCRTERELFDTIGLRWVEPVDREVGP
jgi:DNA polymerase/3'-5' exonuclease PolX